MIGEKEKQRIQAAIDGGWEMEIHMKVQGWRVTITTSRLSSYGHGPHDWQQPWLARVQATKPYTTSSKWCSSADEVDWMLETL